MTATTDLCFTPATELAQLIRARTVSPVEVVEAVLARVAVVDSATHAFVTLDAERARDAAVAAERAVLRGEDLGPLHGIPVSIKDLMPTEGLRTTFGSLSHAHHIPAYDTVAVRRVRAAGGIVFGKTNTPQFGHKDMTDNRIAGATRNPWNMERTAGGSSGGAAAAVAAGMGPLAVGSDAAGSIRIPASLCGVFGLKATSGQEAGGRGQGTGGSGQQTANGVLPSVLSPQSSSLPNGGPLARTVRDGALLLDALAGSRRYLAACEGDLRGWRVAWSADFGYAAVEPEVRRITEAAALRFTDLGAVVEEVTPAWGNPGIWQAARYRSGLAAQYGKLLAEHPEWVDESLKRIILLGRAISADERAVADAALATFRVRAQAFMEPYDLLLTPTMPCGAWSYLGPPEKIAGVPVQRAPGGRWPFLYPFNALGWPAASVPCGFTAEGLPVGLQIVAPWGCDDRCLRATAAFESVAPWADRWPEIVDR